MHKAQQQVREFAAKFGKKTPGRFEALEADELRLCLRLIVEETAELIDASGAVLHRYRTFSPAPTAATLGIATSEDRPSNTVEQIDALCDLLYVTYFMAVKMGVDLEPFFDEVQRANMAKEGGGESAQGKILKPAGWQPPDIAGVFERLYGRSP